jgi:hypothetical protein
MKVKHLRPSGRVRVFGIQTVYEQVASNFRLLIAPVASASASKFVRPVFKWRNQSALVERTERMNAPYWRKNK